MKILYYFPEKPTPMYGWQRVHFFDELKRNNINIHSYNPLQCNNWDEANEEILKLVKQKHFDLFLCSICNEHMLYVDTLQEIKRHGLPTVSFRPDNLSIPFNDKLLAPHFDLLWLTSKETKYLYDKWGVNTVFAPYAANPFAFYHTKLPIERKVCFIGNPYGSRTKMMNELTTNGIELVVHHGKGKERKEGNQQNKEITDLKLKIYHRGRFQKRIERLSFKEGRKLYYAEFLCRHLGGIKNLEKNEYLTILPSIEFNQICNFYSKYALSLASTSTGFTDILSNPLPVINLRNFEIPMSGGIEFCRYNPELAEYFEEGREIVFYHDEKDMIEKATYYLQKASDSVIANMKENARKKAEKEHTWNNRFSLIFKTVGI